MAIDDLVVWTRKKLGMIDEESAEEWRLAKQEEKEKKRLLRKIAKENSHVATLYKDKPKEVLEKVAALSSSWEETEPILAVIASEPVEDQAKVALILSKNAPFTNYVGISEEELVKDLPVSAQIARLGGCEPVVFKVIGDAYDTNNYTAFNRRYNYGPLARLGLSSTHPLISPRILKIINNVKATNFLPIYEKLPCEAQVLSANEISSSSDVGKTLETLTELADFIGDLDVSDEQARYNLNRFLVSQKYTLEEKVDLLRPYEESGRGVKHALLRRFQFCINSGHDLQKLIKAGDFISRKPEWLAEIMLHDGNVYSYEKNIPQMQDYSPEEVAFTVLHGLEKVKGSTGVLSRLSPSDLTTRFSILDSICSYGLTGVNRDSLVAILEESKELLETYKVESGTVPIKNKKGDKQDIYVNHGQEGIVLRILKSIRSSGLAEAKKDVETYTMVAHEGIALLNSVPVEYIDTLAQNLPSLHRKGVDLSKLRRLFQSGYSDETINILGNIDVYVNSTRSPEEIDGLHKNRTLIDILNSEMDSARKIKVVEVLQDLETENTVTDIDTINIFLDAGVRPTPYLLKVLEQSDDQTGTVSDWQSTMKSFGYGNFNPDDELHRNLEYSRFRSIVDHEKVRRHIKNHFTFADYLTIFKKATPNGDPFTKHERFEIECVAYEASLLAEYVMKVKAVADEQGRRIVVVPNLSYGYLPFSPLVDELAEEGIDTIVGAKVGSTESHNNKEVLNSRLFKGNRTKLMKKQPVILIVDGTKHLVARDNNHKDARYPDAHQGYLNQTIAMNDAMGFADIDYSDVGKSEEDMERLRQSDEFQRLVGVYQHVMRENTDGKEAYTFGLWNTAGKELLIRNYHEAIRKVKPYEAESIQGPAMIFCNIGVLDEQVPQQIKDEYPGLEHTPAYYDDSGKIINFDFGYDEHGVRYLNRLETEVGKSYQRMKGKEFKAGTVIPALIGYVNMQQSTGYEEEAA